MTLWLGWFGDTFCASTGPADTLARNARRTVQLNGVPADDDVPGCDAGVPAPKFTNQGVADLFLEAFDALP